MDETRPANRVWNTALWIQDCVRLGDSRVEMACSRLIFEAIAVHESYEGLWGSRPPLAIDGVPLISLMSFLRIGAFGV